MIDKLIGNTPIVQIRYKYKGSIRSIFAKLEYYNYSGSIKDRVALFILKESKRKGLLKENQMIVEATSGNTGISFASLGALYNHPVHIFMPKTSSVERRKLLKLYGAKIHIVNGGFLETIKKANQFARINNVFRPDQFNNKINIKAHYLTTGKEILKLVPNVKCFVSGIGTGGTLIGVGKRLKNYNNDIKVIALEPKSMPLLSSNKIIGPHKIEGIGDDFIPSLVDKKIIDKIIKIDDKDAINMSRLLSRKLGLGVGISSGANFLAGVLSGYNNVVTIFADDSKKYLSTDLLKKLDSNDKLISNNVELLDINAI